MRRNINILNYIIILINLIIQPLAAQETPKKQKEVTIMISIEDDLTYERIQGVKAELLQSDSTLIRPLDVNDGAQLNGKTRAVVSFDMTESGKYLVKLTKEGYRTLYYPLNLHIHPRGISWLIQPAARMHRELKAREYKLGEAVVKATKIKMVMRGDTVVYNADAFQLSQGSMLDALIERLPGVELRDGGFITYNGRPIESLLVNGRDFFKGEPSVALDNLPAYMVNKVKVYEQTSAFQKITGIQSEDKPLVMDVNLKKEYSVGWLANAEAAYGSNDRYLGRIFALGFTPNTHTAVFANFNNTNDTRRPGRRGDWTPAASPTGLQTSQNVGAEFAYQEPGQDNKWSTNFNWLRTDLDRDTRSNSETFLPEGSTYGVYDRQNREKAMSLALHNNFEFYSSKTRFNGTLHVNYDKNRITSTDRSASLSENPFTRISHGLLDSLFTPGHDDLLRQQTLNRYRQAMLSRGDGWGIDLPTLNFSYTPFKDIGLYDRLILTVSGHYNHRDYTAFNQYLLDYPAQPALQQDYRNRYRKRTSKDYAYAASAGYLAKFGNWTLTPKYQYSQSYSSGRDDLYRLDWAEGWGAADSTALGALPSTTTLEQTAHDWANSEDSERWKREHTAEMGLFNSKTTGKGNYFEFRATLPFTFRHERIDYLRGTLQADRTRRSFVFSPNVFFLQRYYFKNQRFVNIEFNGFHYDTPADMLRLLNYRDDADPLNIRLGNPGLKRTYREDARLAIELFSAKYEPLFTLGLHYSVTSNAVAMGSTFNPATGGYTWQPQNVNGNWNAGANLNLVRQFGRQKRFSFSSSTRPTFYHSVDLSAVEGQASSARSVVDNLHLSQTLQLDYGAEKWRIGAKAYANWTYATSQRPGFTDISAVDYHFGLTGRVQLPGGVNFDTDFTLYGRRGYDDNALNSDDMVWNARLSKSILQGNLTFIVDAFDILGQLSNVRRQVNAQGWTETYYNVVPRYVMAHVIYRLNLEPKKKQK